MPNPRRPGIRSRQSLQSSQTSSGAYNTVPAPSFKKTDRFAEKIAQELAQKGPATYLEREAAASTAVSKYERINPSRVSALKTIRRRFEEYVGASRQAWVKTGKRLPPNHDHPSFLVLENTLLLYSATFIYTLVRPCSSFAHRLMRECYRDVYL